VRREPRKRFEPDHLRLHEIEHRLIDERDRAAVQHRLHFPDELVGLLLREDVSFDVLGGHFRENAHEAQIAVAEGAVSDRADAGKSSIQGAVVEAHRHAEMGADRYQPGEAELARGRQLGAVRDELRQAAVHNALAVRIFEGVARAGVNRCMIACGVHIPVDAPPVAEFRNERDVDSEVAAKRPQRARQELIGRHGFGGLVLDQEIQHQYFVRGSRHHAFF
jgi:hypothetical protein